MSGLRLSGPTRCLRILPHPSSLPHHCRAAVWDEVEDNKGAGGCRQRAFSDHRPLPSVHTSTAETSVLEHRSAQSDRMLQKRISTDTQSSHRARSEPDDPVDSLPLRRWSFESELTGESPVPAFSRSSWFDGRRFRPYSSSPSGRVAGAVACGPRPGHGSSRGDGHCGPPCPAGDH